MTIGCIDSVHTKLWKNCGRKKLLKHKLKFNLKFVCVPARSSNKRRLLNVQGEKRTSELFLHTPSLIRNTIIDLII